MSAPAAGESLGAPRSSPARQYSNPARIRTLRTERHGRATVLPDAHRRGHRAHRRHRQAVSCARSSARPEVGRIIGMARRPFDPAAHGWEKAEYRRGDVLDRDAGRRARRRRRRRRPPGVRDRRRPRGEPRVNLDGLAQRLRGRGRGRRQAARLHLVGRGLRVRRDDLPALLTEDVAARGHRAPPLLGPEGRARGALLADALDGSDTEAYVFRPCIVAGADAPLLIDIDPVHRARRGDSPARCARRSTACRCCGRCSPTRASRSSSSTTTTSPRRSCAAVPGERRARRLQPRRRGGAHHLRPRPRAGLALGPGARARGRRDRRDRLAAAVPARPRPPGSRPSARPVLMDTSRARAELRWRPQHDARQTLREMVTAYRGGPTSC